MLGRGASDLDSAVVGAVILGWAIVVLHRVPTTIQTRLHRLAWLVVPGSLIVAAWLVWKLFYYGNWVPNTWYSRNVGIDPALRWRLGLRYLGGFVGDYWLWPFLLVTLASVRTWRRSVHVVLLASVIAW